VLAVGQSVEGNHIEAHREAAPGRTPLQEESSGANDFSLLAPVDRRGRAAEIETGSLPNFDYNQDAVIETHEIKFSALAAQVAREHGEALGM
jgi:hypothetical protein